MSTNKTLQISTDSSAATENLAESLAKNLKGGEVIELLSDLGGGKTTFVRGLVRGLGIKAHVSSPTFKISNIYELDEQTDQWDKPQRVYHYDFYRLADSGLMGNELHESLSDNQGIVVVEWGKVAANILPPYRLKIQIIKTADEKRHIVFETSPKQAYVVAGIK